MAEEQAIKEKDQMEIDQSKPDQPVAGKESVIEDEPKIHWWQFRRKKKINKPEEAKKEEIPEKPTDSLDANLKAMAAHLEVKERNDYWNVRINKKWTLIFGGIIIITLWSGYGLRQVIRGQNWSLQGVFLISEKVMPPPTPTPLPEIMIRVHYKLPENATQAAAISQKLREGGYPVVDEVIDAEAEYGGVYVVAKAQESELKVNLENILRGNYPVSSPAAELTTDSDFDALVFYTPLATASTGVQ